FFFQAEDGIRDDLVTGVQTCALPISIQRLVHSRPELRARVVVLEAAGPRGSCVAACSATGASQGIRPSMPVAEAKSLLRDVVIEIGRASCRERGDVRGVGGTVRAEAE